MSTPMSRIQSGIAYQTSPSGRPDANESSDTESVRFDRSAAIRPVSEEADADFMSVARTLRVRPTKSSLHAFERTLVRRGDRLDHQELDEIEDVPAMTAPVFGHGGRRRRDDDEVERGDDEDV